MGPLYFIPKFARELVNSADELPADTGLRELLAGASVRCQGGPGPGGEYGKFVAAATAGEGGEPAADPLEHDPDAIEWRPVRPKPGGPVTHWLGWRKDRPPRPEDVQRPERIAGHPVRLADGNEWVVPVCGPRHHAASDGKKHPNAWISLPHTYALGDQGEAISRVSRRFESVCEASERWWDRVQAKVWGTDGEVLDYAASLLGLNYRVGRAEIGHLELLDTPTAIRAVQVSLGWVELEALQAAKKQEAGQPAT